MDFMTALIVPVDGDMVMSTEHLGVGYLAAALRRRGFPARIMEVSGDNTADFLKSVLELRPRLIGITLTAVSVPRVLILGKQLRTLLPDTHITCGGPLPTGKGRSLLELVGWEFLDSIVLGEGEGPITALATALSKGGGLDGVPSLCYRAQGAIKCNQRLSPPQLDELSWPARDQFELRLRTIPYLRISTSRGCTSRCAFCNAPNAGNLSGGKVWRGRSPVNVVDEIEYLVSRYNVNTFDFVDSTFEDPGGTPYAKDRLWEIASLILSRNLRIYYNCCMQAVNWDESDKPLLSKMYQAGLEKALVGVESGTEESLKLWGKRSCVSDNMRLIRLLSEQGVYAAFGFIMFHPYSTEPEIMANARFLRSNLGHNLRRFCTRLELYPGTPIVSKLEKDGLLKGNYHSTLDIYGYKFSDELADNMADMCANLFGSEYAAHGLIDKEPAVFAFETFDIVMHTFFSRLWRHCGGAPTLASALLEFKEKNEALKRDIAAFNFALFEELLQRAKCGVGIPAPVKDLSGEVERYFHEKIESMKSDQLRLTRNFQRAGVNVRDVIATRTQTASVLECR